MNHRIAVIAGDGIGKEVVPAAISLVDALAAREGFSIAWDDYDWGSDFYKKSGSMMPADGLEQLLRYDAILLGAIGDPEIPDHLSLWGLLIPIRRGFEQYVNLRPMRVLRGLEDSVHQRASLDVVIVRENLEGEYSQIGGHLFQGTSEEIVIQTSVFSRRGVERIADYALNLARQRSGRLASATKSNGIVFTMPFWDEIVRERAALFPDVELSEYHIDALTALLVLDPERFDVVVASNLFGDILSDLAAAIAGSIGLAPSANLNPQRNFPSMFEPVHGSAPDIAGRGIANPIAQIWSAALMLEHLGHSDAAAALVASIEDVLTTTSIRTPDLGGTATTDEFVAAVADAARVMDSAKARPSHDPLRGRS